MRVSGEGHDKQRKQVLQSAWQASGMARRRPVWLEKTEDEQEDTEVKEVPRSQLNQRLVGTLAFPPSETHGWIFEHDQIYIFTGLSQMLCSE